MSQVIKSRVFEGPFVRVRGRLSRQDVVNWSPCLRTYHPPNWVPASGRNVDDRQTGATGASSPPAEESMPPPDGAIVMHAPATQGTTQGQRGGVRNPHYSDLTRAEAASLERASHLPDAPQELGRGGPNTLPTTEVDGGFTISFEDAAGKVLVRAPVRIRFFARDRQWALFTQRLPYRAETKRVTLRRGEHELGVLRVPSRVPEFLLVHPVSSAEVDHIGILHLRWELDAAEKPHAKKSPLTYYVRYTGNNKQWHRPGVNLKNTSFDLDLREMPGGDNCIAQVIATNGYHTVYAETPSFAVPRKSPEILLASPLGPILFAQGFSREDGPLVGDSIVWLLDARKPIATGASFDARRLGRGVRELAVCVTDARGSSVTQHLGLYDGETGKQISRAGY